MEFLQVTSKLLALPGVILLVWDLVEHWFVKHMLKVRTFKEWGIKMTSSTTWADMHNLLTKLGAMGTKIEQAPGFLVFLAPAAGLYVLYRVIFLLAGGKAGGYKSRY